MIFVGVDIGTSNTKAVALSEDGRILGRFAQATPVTDRPDPSSWLKSFCDAIHSLRIDTRARDLAISVTGQGGSFAALDEAFRPVGEGWCWTALASEETVREIAQSVGLEAFYRKSGWPPSRWLACAKIRELWESTATSRPWRYVAGVHDFIHVSLGGPFVTDISSAQVFGLADIEAAKWDADILRCVGLVDSNLPEIRLGGAPLFEQDLARIVPSQTGTVRFFGSSHDQYAAMLAAGLKPEGPAMVASGTAWVINGKSSVPIRDETQHRVAAGRDALGQDFGYIMTAGPVGEGFDRLLKNLNVTLDDLDRLVPHLRDLPVAAQPVSVDVTTGQVAEGGVHVSDPVLAIRRYMDFAASRMRSLLEAVGRGRDAGTIVMTGGAAKSPVWPQIVADVCGTAIQSVDFPELTAYGAAMWARSCVIPDSPICSWPAEVACREWNPRSDLAASWYEEIQGPSIRDLTDW